MSQQRQSHRGVRRAAGGDHSLAAYLAPDFVIEIEGGSRAAAVAELVACLGRRVKSVSVRETIKEFARLDGAFVVRGDGALLSAGTYLRPETEVPDLPKGLGARHAAAAAITIATGALAVAVSQSTHRISLFKNGRRVLAFQPL